VTFINTSSTQTHDDFFESKDSILTALRTLDAASVRFHSVLDGVAGQAEAGVLVSRGPQDGIEIVAAELLGQDLLEDVEIQLLLHGDSFVVGSLGETRENLP